MTCVYVLTGILGLCVGSFLNVVIYRVPIGLNLAKPDSHCPRCGYRLSWFDNIPVFSYLFLRGKCRKCGVRISPRYMLVEIFNALLWLLAAFLFWEKSIVYAIVCMVALSTLICIFFIDLEHMLIFDRFTILVFLCGLTAIFFDPTTKEWDHIIGAIAAGVSASFGEQGLMLAELRQKFFGFLIAPGEWENGDASLEEVTETLTERALALYHKKEELFGADAMREIERVILLRNVDSKWMEHIDAMDELKGVVGLNSYAQRSPISEYRLEGANMFDDMIEEIRDATARMLLTVMPSARPIERVQLAKPTTASLEGQKPAKRSSPVRSEKKVGRNDPCPCGSGKKYKNCCGAE